MAELPTSAGFQARIDNINASLAGLAGIWNPRRRSLAYDTAAGLNSGGFFDNANVQEVDEGGSLVYRLVRGKDGRLYSQAYRRTNEQHQARGTFYSSGNRSDQRDRRRELDTQRDSMLRQFGNQQQQLTDQQAEEDRRLRGELGQVRGEYADWQSQQVDQQKRDAQPPVPPEAPGAAPTPGAPGANRSGNIVTDLMRGDLSPGALSGFAQKYPGYKVVIAGNGRVVLKKMG